MGWPVLNGLFAARPNWLPESLKSRSLAGWSRLRMTKWKTPNGAP